MSGTDELPSEGELPSFEGATGWLNTEPITGASLRGRPVLIEFWTSTCINWIRTLPYVRAWFEKYRADGLVVLGVHTPEFEVEYDIDHVRRAAREMRIEYPIAVDNDYRIWRAFGNAYWPALYFADANRRIRHHRFGEGEYEQSELVLQTLLASAGTDQINRELVALDPSRGRGPGRLGPAALPRDLHRLRARRELLVSRWSVARWTSGVPSARRPTTQQLGARR